MNIRFDEFDDETLPLLANEENANELEEVIIENTNVEKSDLEIIPNEIILCII